jgi:tetratricopeptide (TPR) repeat protein
MRACLLLLIALVNPAIAQLNAPATCEKGPNLERILACIGLLQQEKSSDKILVIRKNRGQAYSWSRQYDLAVKDFDAVLEFDPSDVDALYGRASALLFSHRYERAVADSDRLIAMGKRANVAAHQLRCRALAGLGKFDEAIVSCSEQLQPFTNPVFLIDRADVYMMAGQYDRAIEDYDAVLKVDKNDLGAIYGRGKAMFAKQDYAAALEEFDRAYHVEDDDVGRAFALGKRGLANEALGRRSAAIADFRQALKGELDLDESKDGLKRLGASPVPEKPWWRFW